MALLEIKNLHLAMRSFEGEAHVLNGIDLKINRGEIWGVVGETGCGKSLTGLSVSRLVPTPPARYLDGEILFEGHDLLRASESADARAARPAHRHDLPGSDDEPEPGLPRSASRWWTWRCTPARQIPPFSASTSARRAAHAARRRANSRSACSTASASPMRRGASTTIPTSSRAACASAS